MEWNSFGWELKEGVAMQDEASTIKNNDFKTI